MPPVRATRRLVLVCALLLIACGGARPPAGSPSVLLITLDTTRADHCSAYGYVRETTPSLTRLAAAGARFDTAYSPTATTGPSHATLFTSLDPLSHHVIKNGRIVSSRFVTLAERFNAAGYRTAGIAGSFVLHSKFGYDQGFEQYQDDFDAEGSSYQLSTWLGHPVDGRFDRRADATTARAIEWLNEQEADEPFFLFVHYFDPHDPYTPPEAFGKRWQVEGARPEALESTIALYDAEIAFTDEQLGRLFARLETLGLSDDTIVVVTADHGEGLMEHGHLTHGVHLYEEQVRVPLLVRWPKRIPAGQVLDGPVGLIDIAPTLLELAGLEVPEDAQGLSLASALLEGSKLPMERPIFLYRRHYRPQRIGTLDLKGEQFGIRRGRWKYIEAEQEGNVELFDLSADPDERSNLVAKRPDQASRLGRELQDWRKQHPRRGESKAPSAEDQERLRALGYVE